MTPAARNDAAAARRDAADMKTTPTKEQAMSQSSTPNRRRELAHRSSDGIDVYLLWSPADDSLAVTVIDEAAETFELPVAPHEALEVFNHPYAYAAFRGGQTIYALAA